MTQFLKRLPVRLTARARLTALLSALFALGGGIILVINYLVVAANLSATIVRTPGNDPRFLATCGEILQYNGTSDRTLAEKCASTLTNGVVVAAEAQRSEVLNRLLLESTAILLLVVAVVAAAAWLLAGRLLRPIRRITEAARAAGEHRPHERLELTGPRDELRELAETFDVMLDRLDASLRSQQQFAANASHELRTPMTVVTTTVDVVLAKPHPTREELIRMGRDVRTAATHADGLIDALLELARSDAGVIRRDVVDLAVTTDRVLGSVDDHGLQVRRIFKRSTLRGDERLIERLAWNLIDNAIRHNIPGGMIEIETGADDDRAFLRISNSGPHVTAVEMSEIFERFARHPHRQGVAGYGLGLSLVQSIAIAHDGTVTAQARPEGGLSVTVSLPTADGAVQQS